MPVGNSDPNERLRLRQMALARWENEGGATVDDARSRSGSGEWKLDVPHLTNAELVQLQVRVIALENLLIALLAEASDEQLDLVREMAAYISPRPGYTPHRLTLLAASEMISLVERATRFRSAPPG
jgi:hypothetical protein